MSVELTFFIKDKKNYKPFGQNRCQQSMLTQTVVPPREQNQPPKLSSNIRKKYLLSLVCNYDHAHFSITDWERERITLQNGVLLGQLGF